MRIQIVPMQEQHIQALAAIEKLCFSAPWSENMLRYELQNKNACYLCAIYGQQTVGYAGMHYVLDECYIDNVAVSPDFRRRGIGQIMVKSLLQAANELGCSFATLEVRESNLQAIELYHGCGFKQVGKRRGYYTLPTEDALLMTYYFNPQPTAPQQVD